MSDSRSSLKSTTTTSTTTSTDEKHKSTISSSSSGSASSTEKPGRFRQYAHNPGALGEAMPVYLRDVSSIILEQLDGDVITHWQGDEKTKKFSLDQRRQFTLFGITATELVDKAGSEEAAKVANLILRGEEEEVEEALALIKENPSLITAQCVAVDPLMRQVLGTPLQIAAMAGDVNLIEGEIKEEKNCGLVERLKSAAGLSDEAVRDQLEEVLTSREAIAENEKRNQRILDAIKVFGEGIIQKAEAYKKNKTDISNFREFQALCQPLIDQLEKALTLDINKVIKLGYVFDPAILQKAAEWFDKNVNRFDWWTIQSDLFWINGVGKLQSKLSSRDAQVMRWGIDAVVHERMISARTLRNSDGSSYFYNSSSFLGQNIFLGQNGMGYKSAYLVDMNLPFRVCLRMYVEQKNITLQNFCKHPDNSKQSKCVIM